MATVVVVGGGLAGLAAAAALGSAGFEVDVFESRAFLGGRATSYTVPGGGEELPEVIDNCQHILLRCCRNLIDFYQRLGVPDCIRFYREYFLIVPGGRLSTLKPGALPPPAHFLGSFLGLKCLSFADKFSIIRGLRALEREAATRTDLDRISMLDWLLEKRQTKGAIERFWSAVLVSAISETLDRMAALHGFQVFRLAFLGSSTSFEMGVPSVPLAELYGANAWSRIGDVRLHLRTPVERIEVSNQITRSIRTAEGDVSADFYISAVPFERVPTLIPNFGEDFSRISHAPITGIHLWFDRLITDLPQAALLDRTIQWVFNKSQGRYLQVVVSASRSLTAMPRAEVIDLTLRELSEFFPVVKQAKLEKAHVVKEVRAVFSAEPGLEAIRPGNRTHVANLFLAGDWTHSGWPATMEGAVRSGYLAAEAIARSAGYPAQFVIPDQP